MVEIATVTTVVVVEDLLLQILLNAAVVIAAHAHEAALLILGDLVLLLRLFLALRTDELVVARQLVLVIAVDAALGVEVEVEGLETQVFVFGVLIFCAQLEKGGLLVDLTGARRWPGLHFEGKIELRRLRIIWKLGFVEGRIEFLAYRGLGLGDDQAVGVFVVNKLALFAVAALAGGGDVPLLAHFGLVVLVEAAGLAVELGVSVGVGTVLGELALARLHPVSAHLCFVVDPEVLYVPDHFGARGEIHLLFGSSVRTAGLALRLLGGPGGGAVERGHFMQVALVLELEYLLLNEIL
mmetsp:Transcript_14516/g.24779  ORF Transcript_14516/g.24779 Transcript_14516/m.24779 type:complete len:296 (-) Transcript_14516:212-1099(-)